MAIAEELRVVINAEVEKALRDLGLLEKQTDKNEKSFEKFAQSATKIGKTMSLAVTAPLTAAAAAFVNLADKQIQAEAALGNALRATGQEVDGTVASLKDYTAQLQDATTYGDEAQLSALALVTQLSNLNEAGLKQVLPGLLDFSTAMGVDLQTAASLVGKTLGSSTNALSRYGIELDATASTSQKLAQLTDQLQSKFGGAAATAAQAGLGPFRQLKNSVGDLGEEFGTLLLPAIDDVIGVISDVVKWMSSLDDDTKKVILTVGGITAAMGPLALAIGAVSTAMKTLVAPPTGYIVAAVAALTALATWLVTVIRRHKEYEDQLYNTADAVKALNQQEQIELRNKFASELVEQNKILQQAYAERHDAAVKLAEAQQAVNEATTGNEIAVASYRVRAATAEYNILNSKVDTTEKTIQDLNTALDTVNGTLNDGVVPAVDRATTAVTNLGDAAKDTANWWDGLGDTIISAGQTWGGDFFDEKFAPDAKWKKDVEKAGIQLDETFGPDAKWRKSDKIKIEQILDQTDFYQAMQGFEDAWQGADTNTLEFIQDMKKAGDEAEAAAEQAKQAWSDFAIGAAADITSAFGSALSGDAVDVSGILRGLTVGITNLLAPGFGALAGGLFDIAKGIFDQIFAPMKRQIEEAAQDAQDFVIELSDAYQTEAEIRKKYIDELDKSFNLETSVIRDMWERNLISTQEFVQQITEANAGYTTGTQAANAAAAAAAAKDLSAAKKQKVDGLNARIDELWAEFNALPWLTKLFTNQDEQIIAQIDVLKTRITAAQNATTLEGVQSAASGANFMTSGPQLLLVGDNASGREHVQVTPSESGGVGGTTVQILGPVYGFDDFGQKAYEAIEQAKRRGRIA